MKLGLVILLLLPVSGCNMAISDKPMFADSDAVNGPRFKQGVWLVEQKDCKVNTAKPAEHWPKCAAWAVVKQNQWRGYEFAQQTGWRWESLPVLAVAGRPPVFQFQLDAEHAAGRKGPKAKSYMFAGFEPGDFDEGGQIQEFSYWVVGCGIEDSLPGKQADRTPEMATTIKRFPGMDEDCRPASPDAIRAAAAASQPTNASELGLARWVRDGFH